MKHFYTILMVLMVSALGFGQTTIGIQDFETSPQTPTLGFSNSGGNFSTGTGPFPTGDNNFVSGSRGWEVSNSTSTLTFNPIDISFFSDIELSFRLASFAGTSGNGSDGPDSVLVEISLDGGTNFSDELEINGNNNAKWSFDTGIGIASVSYDGDNNQTIYTPSGGGYRTTDGYSFISIVDIPNTSNLVVRITMNNNSGNEYWIIDDILIEGIILSGPSNPEAFSASEVSSTQNDLLYDDNTEGDQVVIVYNTDNNFDTPTGMPTVGGSFGDDTILFVGTGSGTYNHTGLTQNTTYYYAVYSYDGSEYSNGLNDQATTPCDAIVVTSGSPFQEGFEGGAVPPACWQSYRGTNGLGTTQDWQLETSTINSGSNSAFVGYENVSGGNAEDWLVTPALDLSSISNSELNFFSRAEFGSFLTEYTIRVSTISQTDIASFSTAATYSQTDFGTSYSQFLVDLSAYDGQTIYIAFVMSQDDGDSWYLDDIEVKQGTSKDADIVEAGFDEPDNIDYFAYQTSSSLDPFNSIKIAEFTLRDSGGTPGDSDSENTELTDITFDVLGFDNIAALALYNGPAFLGEVTNVTASTSFNGISLTALDNGSSTLEVYATFKSTVTDNEQIQLTVSAATANSSGSTFAANDAGGATTSVAGDDNRIEVIATDLIFNEDVSDVEIGTVMNPSPTVLAVDVNANTDLDFVANIDVAASTASVFDPSATVSVTAVSGEATFSNLIFDEIGTGYTLTASSGLLNTDVSSTFDVEEVPVGATDLFFSEYIEGSSNNKYLEIYNGTGASVTLTDYSVELYANGGSTPNNTEDFTVGFPATLADGEVIVLSNSLATIYTGTSFNSSVCNFNGDDAIVLKKAGVIIDIIGNIGCDPGSSWSGSNNSTQDETLIRNADICEGISTDPTASCPFPTLDSEWTSFSTNDISHLGSHTANCGPTTYTFNNGAWTPSDPNGASLSSEAIVIEAGDATINANTDINTVVVNPGASLTVDSGIILSIANPITGLTLESTSSSYSSLIRNGTINGTVNYERFVNQITSGSPGNDLISVPLTQFDLNFQTFLTFGNPTTNRDILAADPGNTVYAFGPYDNTNLTYVNLPTYLDTAPPDPAAEPLISGKGYRAASTSGENVTFTGSALSTDVSIDISTPTAVVDSQWNLIGNPYPSYLNASLFLAANTLPMEDLAEAIYAYNAASYSGNAATTGNFTIINEATILANTGENFNIAPGQGFFVPADITPGFTGTINFTTTVTDMRTTEGADDYIVGRNSSPVYTFKLGMSANNEATTTFFFMDNATVGLNPGYDAAAFGSTNLYSHLVEDNTGRAMALQALSLEDLSNVTIPLGVNANQGVQLTFDIAHTTLPSEVEVFLEDTETNTITLLNNSNYVLTPNTNISGTGRFFLRFSNSTLSTPETDFDNINIYANQNDKTIVVTGQLTDSTKLMIYDLQGRKVSQTLLLTSKQSQSVDVAHLSSGVYVVQLVNTSNSKTKKVILN